MGDQITDIWWTEREVSFILSSGRALRIYLRDQFTEWQILDAAALIRTPGANPLEAPPLLLRYVGAAETIEADWQAGELLAARIGLTLTSLYAGHVWLYVYFGRQKLLSFAAQERISDGMLFLWWAED